jgi:hypothetical protein
MPSGEAKSRVRFPKRKENDRKRKTEKAKRVDIIVDLMNFCTFMTHAKISVALVEQIVFVCVYHTFTGVWKSQTVDTIVEWVHKILSRNDNVIFL